MDNFEMVEKLVQKTGISYEEAKAALENANWNMLDAVIDLERTGRIEKRSGSYSTAGCVTAEPCSRKKDPRGGLRSLLVRLRTFMCENRLVIRNRSSEVFASIPVWIALLLLITGFWAVIVLMVVAFAFGFRAEFEGPELGRKAINDAMNRAGEATENFADDIKEKCSK